MARIASSLPGDLSTRLNRLDSHVRRLKLLRGIGMFGVVTVTACAVGFLLDIVNEFSLTVRLGILGGVLGTCVAGFWLCIVRPLLRQYSAEELAAVVETAHPELRERLTSTIELHNPDLPEQEKGSALMRTLLTSETNRTVSRMDFTSAVSNRRSVRTALGGLAAVAVLLLPFLLSPQGYSNLWARLFTPWQNLDSAGNLYFDVTYGDDVVARGSDVTITAEPGFHFGNGEIPKEVWLNWQDDDGNADSLRMHYDPESQVFSATRRHVFHSFSFNVSAGRTRTKTYDITVVDAPAVAGATLHVQPPPYTGRNARTIDGVVGEMTVFENSALRLEVRFNKPVVEPVKLEWIAVDVPEPAGDTDEQNNGNDDNVDKNADKNAPGQDQPADDANGPQKHPAPEMPTELMLSADRKSATLTMTARVGGQFAIRLVDRHGLENDDTVVRRIIVQRDLPPELSVDVPQSQRVRPTDAVPVTATAQDDVGIGALQLHYKLPDGREDVLRAPAGKLGGTLVAHSFVLKLAELKLKDDQPLKNGQSIEYRIRTADERMLPDDDGSWLASPQVRWSEWRALQIDEDAGAPGAHQLKQRQQKLKDSLTQIRKDVQKNRQQVEGVKTEAEEDHRKQLVFKGDETIDRLSAEQQQLAQRIQQLSAQFARHPLYANLKKQLENVAAENVAPASQQVKQARQLPLKDKPEQLQQAADKLKTAENQLKDLERDFDKLAAIERDLLELNQLAQAAQRLADQAELLDNMLKNPPPSETPQQKQARENAIAHRQQQLKQQHKDLTNRLNDLLKRRPELMDAARKAELDKLAQLSKKAGELSQPQDKLADALRKEAQNDAQRASGLAKKQQKLLDDAQKLGAQAEQSGKNRAVTPLDTDALRKALDELRKGNLAEAEAKQKVAAEELKRLAEELKKNQALPADPQQAARQLAVRQQQLQNDIEQQTQNAPGENASQQQKDAHQQQLRKLAARQAGIQAGIAQLNTPRNNRPQQQQTLQKAADSVRNLLDGKPEQAQDDARQTTEALKKLAKNIGSKQQRTAQALKDVKRLRQQQQQLGRQVEQQTEKEKSGQQSPQKTAEALKKLADKQRQIARKLAEVDAPDAGASQKNALRKSARAMLDLQNGRTQDAETSQAESEQALSRLQKQLAGKSTAEDEINKLAQQQSELKKQADDVLKQSQDDKLTPQQKQQLQKQADKQKQIAEKLNRLDVPAAKPERDDARQKAQSATEAITKADNPRQIARALDDADKAVKQLQKAVNPDTPQTSPAEQAQQLARRQQQAADAAKKNAQSKQVPSTAQLKQDEEQLQKLTRQAERLRAGDAAQNEKKNALEQLRKAGEKKEQLQKLAEKQQNDKTPNDKRDDELQRLIKQDAQAQQNAADALKRLSQKLNKPQSQQQLARQKRDEAEQLNKLKPPQQPDLNQLADKAEKLGRQQAALRKQTQQADRIDNESQRKQQLQKLADKQQQLQRKVQQLPGQQAPLQRAEAQQKMHNAAQSLQKADGQQAAVQQQQAEQALRNLAQRARQLGRPPQQPGGPQQTQQTAQQAQQLAKQQQQLARQVEQLRQQQNGGTPAGQQQAGNSQPGQKQAANQQPGQKQPGQKQPGQNPSGQQQAGNPQPGQKQAGAPSKQSQNGQQENPNPVSRQQQIAQAAGRLALQTARQQGPQSPAAQKALQFAKQADSSAQQANSGQFNQASQTGKQAGETAQQLSRQLANANNNQPGNQALQKQAQKLAQQQAQNAQAIKQLNGSQSARRAGQQAGQKQLAGQTQNLARQFQQTARRLSQHPLSMPQQGQQAQKSADSVNRAQQQAQNASRQLAQGNPAQASHSAKQAAQHLQQASRQSNASNHQSQSPQQSPIPGPVGEQVTNASQALQQAGRQLDNAKSPAGQQGQQTAGQQNAGQGQQQASGKQNGQGQQQASNQGRSGQQGQNGQQRQNGQQGQNAGQGQNGQGGQQASNQGQAGQQGRSGQAGQSGRSDQSGQPGQNGAQQSPGPLSATAQNLRRAAQSFQQAAQQLGLNPNGQQGQGQNGQQAGQGQPGQNSSQNDQPGGNPQDGGDGNGAKATLDLRQVESKIKNMSLQDWGRLPGHLRTEILQGAKRRPNSDYAKLIKLYFRDIAKKEQALRRKQRQP